MLSYSVFEKENVITRSVKLINKGDQKLKIEKIYSACLDMDNENFEMLTLHGSWARERHIQRDRSVTENRWYPLQKENPVIRSILLWLW